MANDTPRSGVCSQCTKHLYWLGDEKPIHLGEDWHGIPNHGAPGHRKHHCCLGALYKNALPAEPCPNPTFHCEHCPKYVKT